MADLRVELVGLEVDGVVLVWADLECVDVLSLGLLF